MSRLSVLPDDCRPSRQRGCGATSECCGEHICDEASYLRCESAVLRAALKSILLLARCVTGRERNEDFGVSMKKQININMYRPSPVFPAQRSQPHIQFMIQEMPLPTYLSIHPTYSSPSFLPKAIAIIPGDSFSDIQFPNFAATKN